MKKTLFIMGFLSAFFAVSAQDVDRQYVLLEKFTGTWCDPCAVSVPQLDQAVKDGCDFALIAYQYRDQFTNDYGNARFQYYTDKYGGKGIPFHLFDGLDSDDDQDKTYFDLYKRVYAEQKAIKSPLFIEVNKQQGNTGREWTVNVTVTRKNTAFTNVDNLKIFAALTENDIRCIWKDQTRLQHVERTMFPNASGQSVSFENNVYSTTYNIKMDSQWQPANCELVIFVQDVNSYDVIQAYKVKFFDNITVETPEITSVVQPKGTQSALISWDAVQSTESNKLLGYNIYNPKTLQLLNVGLVTNDYFVTKTNNQGEFCYLVAAVYELCLSGDSKKECVGIEVLKSPTAFDSVPRGNASSKITFKWEAPQGYGPGSGAEDNIAGYDLFRNGNKINAELIKDLTYTDIVDKTGKYAYAVVAQYQSEYLESYFESPKTKSIVVTVNNLSEGVNDLDRQLFKVYPNPVTGNILNVDGDYDRFAIVSTSGKIVLENVYTGKSIDVSSLKSGIYFLKLMVKNRSCVIKIVKL